MGAEGRQNNKQKPIIDGSGEAMVAVNKNGDDDHLVGGDDDDRAPGDLRARTAKWARDGWW